MNDKQIGLGLQGLGVFLALLGLGSMVGGSYILMLVEFLLGGFFFFMGIRRKEMSNRMSTKMERSQDSTVKYVTDKEVLNRIKEPEADPLSLNVSNLQKDYLVDYDLKTWKVKDMRLLYWTEGTKENEHEVERYVELEEGKEEKVIHVDRDRPAHQVPLSAPVNVFTIDKSFEKHLTGNSFNAPTSLEYKDQTFFRETQKKGFNIDPEDKSYDIIESYNYLNEKRDEQLRIDFWGGDKVECYYGKFEKIIMFDNVLPVEKRLKA